MDTMTFIIAGMHCDGCAACIRILLSREPGLREARVSFADGFAEVRHNPHRLAAGRLREIIEAGGFHVVERNA